MVLKAGEAIVIDPAVKALDACREAETWIDLVCAAKKGECSGCRMLPVCYKMEAVILALSELVD